MAPRQRISKQPSQEELSLAALALAQSSKPLLDERSGPVGSPSDAEIESAREAHDIFNVVALLFVIAATVINWDLRLLGQGPSQAWIGNYFYLNWATSCCYFLIDLIWVACVPMCVKSPDVIIKHHFVAIAYLSGPLFWPQYRWFMGACLTVEINTWFLILRRVLYKRKDRISPIITELVSISFYVSWIVIRIFVYPAIMYIFCQMAFAAVEETGVLWHLEMIFIPVHFFLCILNFKWTYDLFQPMFTKALSLSKEDVGVSSGL